MFATKSPSETSWLSLTRDKVAYIRPLKPCHRHYSIGVMEFCWCSNIIAALQGQEARSGSDAMQVSSVKAQVVWHPCKGSATVNRTVLGEMYICMIMYDMLFWNGLFLGLWVPRKHVNSIRLLCEGHFWIHVKLNGSTDACVPFLDILMSWNVNNCSALLLL